MKTRKLQFGFSNNNNTRLHICTPKTVSSEGNSARQPRTDPDWGQKPEADKFFGITVAANKFAPDHHLHATIVEPRIIDKYYCNQWVSSK